MEIQKFFKLKEVFLYIFLFVLAFLINHTALSGWWRWDDSQILLHAINHSPLQYFFYPNVWHELSSANLTPWLTFSYDIDLWLSGLRPQFFYLHHILSLSLAAVMTLILFRLWVNSLWAFLGAILFLVGAPSLVVAQQLMTRHYIEGLVFTQVSLYLFVLSLRKRKIGLSWIGGMFYLLVVTAKEIYVPLVILLPFIPEGMLRERIKHIIPFVLMTLFYIPWRWYMLGILIGGYSPIQISQEMMKLIINGHLNMPVLLFGKGAIGYVGLSLLGLVIGAVLVLRYINLKLMLISTLLLIIPLFPLTIWPGISESGRYLLLLWWAICYLTTFSLSKLSLHSKRLLPFALVAYGLIFAVIFHHAWQTHKSFMPMIKEFESQGRFVWQADRSQVLLATPGISCGYWYIAGLIEIQRRLNLKQYKPTVITDEIQLIDIDRDNLSFWRYNPSCGCVENIANKEIEQVITRWQKRNIVKPLSFRIEYKNQIVSWEFGPYSAGTYYLISSGKYNLPKNGVRRASVSILKSLLSSLYVRYDSPEGWITYSPQLIFVPDGAPTVWERH